MSDKPKVTKSAWGVVHKMGPDQADLGTHGNKGRKRKLKKYTKTVTL